MAANTTISCFHCGVILHVIKEPNAWKGKRYPNCVNIGKLLKEDAAYIFFERDKGERVDFKTSYLCLHCSSIVRKLTKRYGPGKLSPRRLKKLPYSSKFVTMGLAETPHADPNQDIYGNQDIYEEHNYSAEPFSENNNDHSRIVLNQSIPGDFDVNKNCFNCGSKFGVAAKSQSGNQSQFVHEILNPGDCKDIFILQSDLSSIQREVFLDARLCRPCINFVMRKLKPPNQHAKWIDQVMTSVKSRSYKAAFNLMIEKSVSARKDFETIMRRELTSEIKKIKQEGSVFTRKMTSDTLSRFSLEEVGLEVKKTSPFISDILTALFPSAISPSGKPLWKFTTVEEAQTAIDSRLGLIMSLILYTHSPGKFNFVQSCLGTRLWQEETSYTSLGWLHQAGLVQSQRKIKTGSRQMMEGAPQELEPKADAQPIAVDHPNPSDISNLTTTGPLSHIPTTSVNGNSLSNQPMSISQRSSQPMNINQRSNQPMRKSHTCSVCGKSFRYKFAQITHQRSHFATRMHQCKKCGKAFKMMGHVHNHNCIVPGTNPDQRQVTKISSVNHQMIQKRGKMRPTVPPGDFKALFTREQPKYQTLPCDICGKIFMHTAALNKHKRQVHAGRPYMCQICLRTYSCESLLQEHLQQCRHRGSYEHIQNTKRKKSNKYIAKAVRRRKQGQKGKAQVTKKNPQTSSCSLTPSQNEEPTPDIVLELGTATTVSLGEVDIPTCTIVSEHAASIQQPTKRSKKKMKGSPKTSSERSSSGMVDKIPPKQISGKLKIKKTSNQKKGAQISDLDQPHVKKRKTSKRLSDHIEELASTDSNWQPPVKKKRKSSKKSSNEVGEPESADIPSEVTNHDLHVAHNQLDSTLESFGGSGITSEIENVNTQSLLSQLNHQPEGSDYVQLLAVPVGMSTEEGYISLDGVIDWSLDEPGVT